MLGLYGHNKLVKDKDKKQQQARYIDRILYRLCMYASLLQRIRCVKAVILTVLCDGTVQTVQMWCIARLTCQLADAATIFCPPPKTSTYRSVSLVFSNSVRMSR